VVTRGTVVGGSVELVGELRIDCGGWPDVEGRRDVDGSEVDESGVDEPPAVVPGRTAAFGDVPPEHEAAPNDTVSTTISPQRRLCIAIAPQPVK
jgi:hypothetical protein